MFKTMSQKSERSLLMYFLSLSLPFIALLLSHQNVHAQQPDDNIIQEEFGLNVLSAPYGALVLIYGDWLHHSSAEQTGGWVGYNIYRHLENDTANVRITDSPLSRVGSLARFSTAIGGPLGGIVSAVGAKDSTELWQMILDQNPSVQVLEALFKPYRKLMGHSFADTDVIKGETYLYFITRVDTVGNESPASTEMIVTVGEPLWELIGPLDLSAEPGDHIVTVSWQPNRDDSGAFSYNVYRSPDSTGYYMRLNRDDLLQLYFDNDSLAEMTWIDSAVQNDHRYYYSVVSADYAGNESSKEKRISAKPLDNTSPGTPQNVRAFSGNMGIVITWDKPDDDDIAGYKLFRSNHPDSSFIVRSSNLLPYDSGFYEDHTAGLYNEYFYRVTAVDRVGNESELSAQAVSTYRKPPRPLAPSSVTAVPDSGRIALSWQSITDSLVRGYYVYRSDRWQGDFTQISNLLNKEIVEFVDSSKSLSSRGTYFYALRSVTTSDMYSPYTEAVSASPLSIELPAPPTSYYGYTDISGNRLFWVPPMDNMVTGYYVYRALQSDHSSDTLLTERPLPSMRGHFTDTLAQIGVEYSYYLRSVNADSTLGKPSHRVSLVRHSDAPLPPSDFSVFPVNGGIKIEWSITHQENALGYTIYRRTTTGTIEQITPEPLKTNIDTFVDHNFQSGQRIYYSLAIVGVNGVEGLRSNEISIMVK